MNIIWLKSLSSNQLALGPNMFKQWLNPKRVVLHYGSMEIELDVVVGSDIPEQTVGLPTNFLGNYTVPTDIPYECIMKAGQLYIGPVIAYVVLGSFKQLNKGVLSLFLPRFTEHETVKGLIYVCTADSINIDQSQIEGYYYNPSGAKAGRPWKRGRFPLPNAIFNRSVLSQRNIKALRMKIGDTIFNSYWYGLNKLNIWRYLSKDEKLKKHLPYTEKFTGPQQLYRLLNKYDSLYIKPFNSSRGRGILNVSKINQGILVIDERRKRYRLQDNSSIQQFFAGRVKRGAIVQQGVPFKIGNQILDFRVFLQRDGDKQWSCPGIIGRISLAGSIITNLQGREKMLEGREALSTVFKMDETKARITEQEVVDLVIKAVKVYEDRGIHIGDVAADIVLDSELNIWLLELQLNYAADNVPGKIPAEMFKKIMVNPFRYAKTLAGFNNQG